MKTEQDLKDTIAQNVKDCVTTYLCNYTHAKGDLSDEWFPIHDLINTLDKLIESTLLKIGCEKEEARRAKFRDLLVQVEAQKVDRANARIRELEEENRTFKRWLEQEGEARQKMRHLYWQARDRELRLESVMENVEAYFAYLETEEFEETLMVEQSFRIKELHDRIKKVLRKTGETE